MSALVPGGERFGHACYVLCFNKQKIAQPGDRQEHDSFIVGKDESEPLAFGYATEGF
jgi:hypothetical protein